MALLDQAWWAWKGCIDGSWYEVDLVVESSPGVTAAAAAAVAAVVVVSDILVDLDSAGSLAAAAAVVVVAAAGFGEAGHLEQVSIPVGPAMLVVVETGFVGADTGESVVVDPFDAEAVAAASVAGCVSTHGPAMQSERHGQHERQGRHACSCQRGRPQVAVQLRIGFA